jgi:transcriptional regulator with XRE-family HTH domain
MPTFSIGHYRDHPLVTLRDRLGWSLDDLSRYTGLSTKYLVRVERFEIPRPRRLYQALRPVAPHDNYVEFVLGMKLLSRDLVAAWHQFADEEDDEITDGYYGVLRRTPTHPLSGELPGSVLIVYESCAEVEDAGGEAQARPTITEAPPELNEA